ncbi:phosphoenolpyruvate mutase [Pseudomonas amygdali]|uniref:phosphoenolpyruvate mutase n=1 Tax=Pseudomonas amygdali TaxID=47877 RepID=UPI000CD28770|nr:phosphoenolpyruvate mutase [Pseudomonas amygdali]POC98039.1 phosphoenolpyruvate mutase [Pseudomonas amygdali pv. morsprunorum]POD36334.1 phosphoenolpyruvate mutase [Pseudomonas amygdali pv. morsprunorum]POD37653.1 phosphoenolpyruvate mutase [Pseudomonas amygdali pv. morsprunorum]POY79843.1 phosphoenolpyruvate mutase [Pseudomonas amygdali pv. morsprunorum]
MKKPQMLEALFTQPTMQHLLGVHDALSAVIAERAGFKGAWISGLGLSATAGVRDSNELSWTQVLERTEQICDRLEIPCLLDIDTGFGDFNNVRLTVQKMKRIGVAGACIEDKLFPKTNSFIGNNQSLADVTEFCGKIRAAKDTVGDDIYLVARCEALVCGQGMSEAIERCQSYEEAGADAILIHSKNTDGKEILEFMRQWRKTSPVVIVPTKYTSVPSSTFDEAGVAVAIWANQSLRAAILGMEKYSQRIFKEKCMSKIEADIAPLDKIFTLINNDELERAKAKYA